MKKYFYFRGEGTLANDDGKGDSVLIPIENITGFQASGDTTLNVHYKPQETANMNSDFAIAVSDQAALTITTAKRKLVMEALAAATNMSKAYIRKLMGRKSNVYINAEEAIELGIADQILPRDGD